MSQTLTDIQIIELILGGQTQLYSLLVKRHQRFVFTLALRFVKNREEAEEIAQDCFIKAYKALMSYNRSAKFSTWLYSITYNTSMTYLRKKKVQTLSVYDEQIYQQIDQNISNFKANSFDKTNVHAFINVAITQLNEDDASIIMLFYMAEQSLEEIAKVMSLEANTVKVKLHRARHKLKDKLQDLLKDEIQDLI